MEKNGLQERRRHGRARIHMEAILEGERPGEDLRLTVMNFSVGGFFCRSSRPLTPLTRLGITFQFPPYAEHPPRMIETTAIVVRCEQPAGSGNEYHVAACLADLTPEAKDHIQGYVDWYELVYGGVKLAAEGNSAS